MKKYVKRTEQGFAYFDVGSENHGRKSYRIYVANSLIEKDEKGEFVAFPCKATFKISPKGTKTLARGDNFVADVFVKCGYRGGSGFKVVEENTVVNLFTYYDYESERGSLGVSTGAFVEVNKPVITIKWKRTGRTYGQPDIGVYKYDLIRDEKIEAQEPEEEKFLEENLQE